MIGRLPMISGGARLRVAFAFVAALHLSMAAAQGGDAPSATIVVAADASRVDRFAAAELKRCLHASLGWDATVAADRKAPANAPAFFVGSLDSPMDDISGGRAIPTEKLRSLASEGVYLHGDGKKIVLVGQGPRGGLYAVYQFLEKHVGCHWPEPGREHIPKQKSLNLHFDELHNPAFRYRGLGLHGPCSPVQYREILDWMVKNRLNTVQFSCEVYEDVRPEILEYVLDRGLVPKIGAHSRQFFYPSAKYFPRRPEQFALVQGKRTGETQLCYSNHDSCAEYTQNIIAYLEERPEIGIVGLWPSDGYGFCECDRCAARQTTDVLLDYINDATGRIRAQLPNVQVEFLSYIHYTRPPETIKPHASVIPTYCEYTSRSQFHSIVEERASHAKCRDQLERWTRLTPQTTVYAYYGDDLIRKFLYHPVPDVVVADLAYYRGIGAAGSSVLMMNPGHWWVTSPHIYAYARASWNSTDSLDAINADYFSSLYGPAAESMRAHQQSVRALFDATFPHGQTGEDMLFSFKIKKFDPDQEEAGKRQFAAAVKRTRDHLAEAKVSTRDARILQRIETLDRDAQLLGLVYEIVNEAAGYRNDRNPVRKNRVVELIERAVANQVATTDDIRRVTLRSLMPTVSSVLGEQEAAKYAPVYDYPRE